MQVYDPSYDTPQTVKHLFFYLDGRISRSQFWWGWVTIVVVSVVGEVIDAILPFEFLSDILCGFMMWPEIAVSVKRCHDRCKSGWWCLLIFIPIIGIIILIVTLGFMRGTDEENRYGQPVVPPREV